MTRTNVCGNCDVWVRYGGSGQGECHRRAPGAVTQDTPSLYIGSSVWPRTSETDFCGDHVPKKAGGK